MPLRVRRLSMRLAPGLLVSVVLLATLAILPATSQDQPPAPPPAAPGVPSPSPVPPAAPPAAGEGQGKESLFEVFYKTGLDTSKAYAVTDLTLKKDTVTLLLKHGTVFLMQPIDGAVTGAVFIGDGVATTTPPNGMERYMLRKYSGSDTLNEPFTEAVLRFSDGSHKTIVVTGRSVPPDSAQGNHASQIWSERNGWLDGTRWLHLEMQYL